MKVDIEKWDDGTGWLVKDILEASTIIFEKGFLKGYKKPGEEVQPLKAKPIWIYKIKEGEKIVWREND